MFSKTVVAVALTAFVAVGSVPTPARAQLNIEVSNLEPITKLTAEKWVYLVTHIVNASNLIGKDAVYMVNATGEDIATVVCRGYQLVGPKPSITSNRTANAPLALPKWSVMLVPTETFNDYCTKGIQGTSNAGTYPGILNAPDKTFQSSTFVYFRAAGQ